MCCLSKTLKFVSMPLKKNIKEQQEIHMYKDKLQLFISTKSTCYSFQEWNLQHYIMIFRLAWHNKHPASEKDEHVSIGSIDICVFIYTYIDSASVRARAMYHFDFNIRKNWNVVLQLWMVVLSKRLSKSRFIC